MIDWRKQTNKQKTPSNWGWCRVAEAPFVVCSGVAMPSCLPTATAELPGQQCLVMCAGGQSSIPQIHFYLFFEVSSWRSMYSRFQLKEEQRGGAGYVQELAQALLTFLTRQSCDSRCGVVFQGMIWELQVVWEACPYTVTFLPVSSQKNNA